MQEESRIKRWRQHKRAQGLKAVTIWLTPDEELRLKDLALQWHCSPSAVMQRALAQVSTSTIPHHSSPTNTLLIRELIREELAAMQAAQASITVGPTVGATDMQPQATTATPLPVPGYEIRPGHGVVTTLPAEPVTPRDNIQPARTVIQKEARRDRAPLFQAKLTLAEVEALRAKYAQGVPMKALLAEYGISKATFFRKVSGHRA